MDPVAIIVFIILFLLSAFFSASETAFTSVPSYKVEAYVKQKKFWAKALKKLKSNTDRLLITILIWNNLVNTLTASLATSIAMDIANNLWATWSSGAIWIATWVVTILLLLFWEIFPKTLATRYASKIALSVSKIYNFLQIILFPIIRCIEKLMKLLQKKKTETKVTDEDLEAFIDMSKDSGAFESGEYERLKNMLDFYEITCEEIMTPRVKIDAIPNNLTVDEAIDRIFEYCHSRILVYTETVDDAEWVVTLKELLQVQRKWQWDKKLSELSLWPVIKVALTKPIHLLLELFKKMRRHIAIVIDEFGWIAWLVSLEDVVEEVFGDIQDETDNEIDPIRTDWNWSFLFQSEVRVEEMLDKFELTFDEVWLSETEFSGETLSYFVMSYFERLPKKWEEIILDIKRISEDEKIKDNSKLFIRVMSVRNNKIWDIKVSISE